VIGFATSFAWAMVILSVTMTVVAFGLWFERKFAARMGSRLGPTIVGPAGLLQPFADVVKLLQKEDIIPDNADRALFNMAPLLGAICALGASAVIPYNADYAPVALDVGVVFVLAIGAVNVLPVLAAGWASNNKFALLGGMRAVAQAVSYEVPLVLSALVPVVLTGSMNFSEIVKFQAEHGWLVGAPLIGGKIPLFVIGFPAFLLFFIAMLAEANRIPFDIPEAESELVAGVTTEYTGMKFGLFYMTEYVHTLVASGIAAALFMGGWHGPFAPGMHWFLAKTFLLFFGVYWIRWTLLRFRSDQLLKICWHYLVPFGVLLVGAAAVWVVLGNGG
jgi:NADH-quinone oxidoreductase subunit H